MFYHSWLCNLVTRQDEEITQTVLPPWACLLIAIANRANQLWPNLNSKAGMVIWARGIQTQARPPKLIIMVLGFPANGSPTGAWQVCLSASQPRGGHLIPAFRQCPRLSPLTLRSLARVPSFYK